MNVLIQEKNTKVNKRILWWGRHGNYGPNYPRNRTIIQCLKSMGHEVIEFQPRFSKLADLEVRFKNFKTIDLVWVPCFRQRDISAASRWAKKHNLPLIFDPLISAYDKRVHEKKKYAPESKQAKRLLNWEKKRFALADFIIADTECHKQYFIEQLGCHEDRVKVIPVSAEEAFFFPEKPKQNDILEVLFFGTFISLQGPKHIAEAIQYYNGPPIKLVFLGDGPERKQCETIVQQTSNRNVSVQFEDWIPFHDLPERIRRSDICLGIFGVGEKSHRVIPNKVYQSLACGKPVITMKSDAYPGKLLEQENQGIMFCEAGNLESIASSIMKLITHIEQGKYDATSPRSIYDQYFSNEVIKSKLVEIINQT